MCQVSIQFPQFRTIATRYFSAVEISTREGCVHSPFTRRLVPGTIPMKCFNVDETSCWDNDWFSFSLDDDFDSIRKVAGKNFPRSIEKSRSDGKLQYR